MKLMMLHMDRNHKTYIHITELSGMNRKDTQNSLTNEWGKWLGAGAETTMHTAQELQVEGVPGFLISMSTKRWQGRGRHSTWNELSGKAMYSESRCGKITWAVVFALEHSFPCAQARVTRQRGCVWCPHSAEQHLSHSLCLMSRLRWKHNTPS